MKLNTSYIIKGAFLILIYSGIIIYLALTIKHKINYFYLLLAVLLGVIGYLILGVRWCIHLSLFKNKIKVIEIIRMEFMAKFLNLISPFQLSIPFRSFFLKKHNIRIANSLSLSFFDLANDFVITSVLILISALFFEYDYKFLFIVPCVGFMIIFLLSKPIYLLVNKYKNKIKNKFVKFIYNNFTRFIQSLTLYSRNPRKYFYFLAVIVLLWMIRIFRINMAAKALGVNLPLYAIMFAVAMSYIIGFISRVPGGLGVGEVTGMLILQNYVDANIALSIFLIERVITTSLVLFIGGGMFVFTYGTNLTIFIKKLKKHTQR